MSRSPNFKTKRLVRGIAVAAALGLAAVAIAEQVVIHKDLDVVKDKNPLADTVESVPTDTKLEVLSRDGSWVRVRTPAGKEGYVTADDVSPTLGLAGAAGSGEVNGISTAAAGRGLEEDSRKYAQDKNLKTDGVNAMIAMGNSVSKKDLRDFAKAGNVGPAKYRDKK